MQIYNNLMILSNDINLSKIYDIAEALLERYRERLVDIDAYGTGNLINSLDYDVVMNLDAITITFSVIEYYWFVEHGRGPTKSSGWTNPIEDLSKWLQSKIERGKWLPRPGKPLPTTIKEIRKVAYPIYLSITDKGYQRDYTKAEPLQRTLDSSEDLLTQFADEVAQQIGGEVEAAWLDINKLSKNGSGGNRTPGNQQIKGK